MTVALCHGNVAALQRIAASTASLSSNMDPSSFEGQSQQTASAARLASSLSSLYSGAGNITPDMRCVMVGADGVPMKDACGWICGSGGSSNGGPVAFAVAGRLPPGCLSAGEVCTMRVFSVVD